MCACTWNGCPAAATVRLAFGRLERPAGKRPAGTLLSAPYCDDHGDVVRRMFRVEASDPISITSRVAA
jgi:hypothetical protein